MSDRLKYLLEKEIVAGLDKAERYELAQLRGEWYTMRTEEDEDRLAEILAKHDEVGYVGLTSEEQKDFDILMEQE